MTIIVYNDDAVAEIYRQDAMMMKSLTSRNHTGK